MLRLFKSVAWLGVLMAGLPAARAFSLLGPPNEAYQVQDLGYMLPFDIGAPKNIGEEYRRNTPVIYYAFDQNFLDYFGSNGVWAVDQAFAILNNLTNVSSYSADLSEFPLESTRFNQRAGALQLMDLKSAVLGILVEELGLADPIRYTWTLHNRTAGADCPVGNQYLVVKRNLEIVPTALDQLQYSSYVNGVLYSYYIHDYCANPPFGRPLSDAVEIPLDVPINAARFTPVASFTESSLYPGEFYTGLTRDDVAGLRYLYRSGNVNWEDNPANSIVFVTNNAPIGLQLLTTSNLTLFAEQSLTNDDAGLLTLYPGLVIVPNSTIPSFTNVITTNLTAFYTNYPYDPIGTPPHLAYLTNYDTNVMTVYTRQFANLVTNSFSTRGYVTVIDTNIYFPPNAAAGYFETNIVTTTMLTNMVAGDFYIIPTNGCDVQILSNVLTKGIAVTNSLVVTNVPTSTNVVTGTYLLGRTYINWFSNSFLAYYPVLCVTNEPSLRRGIEKVTFVKTAYDSLLGKFYTPQTNYFTMVTVTNSTNWVQTFQRVATNADILFTATDALPGPAAPFRWFDVARNIIYNTNNELPTLAGPGTIDPPTVITFNKAGPVYYNIVTNHIWALDELVSDQRFMWASFDDSTNAPVVYPNGTSIQAVESQMLMQVTSVSLPPAHVGTAYTTQLTGTGGTPFPPPNPPYTWSLAPDSAALPAGLGLAASGQLSGTPTATGVYYFFVQMTDSVGGFSVWQVTLTVLP